MKRSSTIIRGEEVEESRKKVRESRRKKVEESGKKKVGESRR